MNMAKHILRCLRDERGGEVLEYALVCGLLFVVCITLLHALGIKVLDRWQRIYDLM